MQAPLFRHLFRQLFRQLFRHLFQHHLLQVFRQGLLFLIAVLGLCAYPSFSLAQTATALHEPSLAARVNGVAVHRFTLDVMAYMAQLSDPKTSRAVVLESLLANRLLAQTARRDFAEYTTPASANRVGFAAEVALDDQLSGTLRTVYRDTIEASIKNLAGGNLNSLVLERGKLATDQLDLVFGPSDKVLLDYQLTPSQLSAAKRQMVLRSSLAAASSISLYDIFVRQNVQGRVEFFNRNRDSMQQQAMLLLGNLYLQQWANQRFGADAVADLRLALSEQIEVRALMSLHGVGADIDSESQLLNRLASQVTAAEVQSYFQSHKEEFKRIVSVKARHIRSADEASARSVIDAAAKGVDFSQLARQYSKAADAAQGGDLGLIMHRSKMSWLEELAFMQDVGKVSPPFRAAVGPKEQAYWEIVLVEQRKEGYQDPKSETVRYQAARALAQEKALRQISNLRQQLLKNAKIEINRQSLG
ncbi:peptidylprolyl isomerase [Undibacterium sp.]|uniref:peptidylprolyl isomerase n=1 Tax=Undibacterium sp. TaxID=1914977 RepID=UPI0025D1C807|nr:peptidylprolyl isomerase [Undibacterium sp.]